MHSPLISPPTIIAGPAGPTTLRAPNAKIWTRFVWENKKIDSRPYNLWSIWYTFFSTHAHRVLQRTLNRMVVVPTAGDACGGRYGRLKLGGLPCSERPTLYLPCTYPAPTLHLPCTRRPTLERLGAVGGGGGAVARLWAAEVACGTTYPVPTLHRAAYPAPRGGGGGGGGGAVPGLLTYPAAACDLPCSCGRPTL